MRTHRLGGLLALLILVLLASCTPHAAYIAADRATYDAIAPAHALYLENDTLLTEETRSRRVRLLKSWELRIRKAEGEDK